MLGAAQKRYTGCSAMWPTLPTLQTQALVYDILPWKKVPESDGRSVPTLVSASIQTGHFSAQSRHCVTDTGG